MKRCGSSDGTGDQCSGGGSEGMGGVGCGREGGADAHETVIVYHKRRLSPTGKKSKN